MLERLARFVIRRRRGVLVAAVVFLLAAGALAGGVSSRLSAGGFDRHDSEAAKAGGILAEEFRSGTPNLVLLVTDPRGADHPAVIESGTALTRTLATENGIITADSYWTLGRPESLRSRAGDHALVLARIAGDEDAVATRLQDLRPRYQGTVNGLEVRLGGQAAVNEELVSQTEQDLVRAEVIIFPITLVALVFVFGSVVAASLPLAVGAFAMIGAMLVLWILAAFTDVSVFALNVIIGLGLGLAIDYSLFVVSRFREELRHGRDVDEAIVTTVRTAGRTVLFAAVTIACAMSGLLVFPIYFLRSFGYAAIATTLVAALGAIIVLPALLRVIGRRVDRLRLIRPRERPRIAGGFWRRIALAVMRRPLPVATTVILVLLVLGSPFLAAMASSKTSPSA